MITLSGCGAHQGHRSFRSGGIMRRLRELQGFQKHYNINVVRGRQPVLTGRRVWDNENDSYLFLCDLRGCCSR